MLAAMAFRLNLGTPSHRKEATCSQASPEDDGVLAASAVTLVMDVPLPRSFDSVLPGSV